MLKVLKFFFVIISVIGIIKATGVVLWLIPIVTHQAGTGLLGFLIVSIIMILLAFHEFKGLNLNQLLLKRKELLEVFFSSLYLVLICVLGFNLKQELMIDDNFTWDDGELYELESFDEEGKTYLRETEIGYELLLKKGKAHQDLNEYRFEEIIIYERIDAEPTIKIYSGHSNTWFEQLLDTYFIGNRERYLFTKVKVEIYLPIMEDSYFVENEGVHS